MVWGVWVSGSVGLGLDITGERIFWTDFNDLTWLGGSKGDCFGVFFI